MSHAPVGSRPAFSRGYTGTILTGEHAPVGNRSSGSYRGHVCDLTGSQSSSPLWSAYCPSTGEGASYCPSTGVSTVYQSFVPQHAPVGTDESSALNGRVHARLGGSMSSAAPASFDHADDTREEAAQQYQDGVNQVGEGVDKLIGDHHPWDAAKTVWGGLQDLDASADKYHAANAEMMEAARDQAQANRGGSPDGMNMESHQGSGGGGCVIC